MAEAIKFFIEKARFQQKQLQEKEEKLLKLYEEQQERALKSVGSHSQSGGSSVSSTSSVGVGKVRHMFQSRRGNSESRLGAAITGRDKSYPLEPLTKYPSARNLEPEHNQRYSQGRSTNNNWGPTHQRSVSLDRHNNEFFKGKNDYYYHDVDHDENHNYRQDQTRKIGVRRSQSQARSQKPKTNFLYFGGSHADLHFPEELDYGQSFQVVDDHYEKREPNYQDVRNAYEEEDADDYFVTNFNSKKQFYENRLKSEQNNNIGKSVSKLSGGGLSSSQNSINKMEGRYKSYVSQNTFTRKPHLGNGTVTGRSGLPTRQTTEIRETTTAITSSGYLNGGVNSPVRKIRKPTPVPLSVAPPQHLLQKEIRKTTARTESIKEIPSSISSPRTPAPRTQTISGVSQKPPTTGRSLPPTRVTPTKSIPPVPSVRSAPPSDLVNCRICGRHFAADRVSKHEEVCQKSSKKRKPFDALQQRVKGTEVEKYVKKPIKAMRNQPDKPVKPQTDWRKKHEEFIKNIRAAKEVSAHLKKGGKLSDLPPPPPSDYSDYIQCPHCLRKFNSSAAERHIPKCANIINNKPKPTVQKNSALKQGSKLLHTTSPSVRGRK